MTGLSVILASILLGLLYGHQTVYLPEQASTILDQHELAVVSFVEDWCDACYRLSPVMQSIEDKMIGSSIRFAVVDLDNDRHAWQHYGVEALPHVALFCEGTPIGYSGDLQFDDIEVWIKAKVGRRPVHIGGRFGGDV